MPKEFVCSEPGKLNWREYAEPDLAEGQVRIRCHHGAAKHGTELAIYKGYAARRGRFDPGLQVFDNQSVPPGPFVPGNMQVGEVVEADSAVTGLAVGDRVLIHGGFRPTHVVHERQCRRLEPGDHWKSAVCLDPADFAMAAVRDGNVRVGDAVAVFGLGAIGLMAVQLARLSGARPVIGVDPLPTRREVARGLGVDMVLDPTAFDAGVEIKKATAGRGADVVIEYSGAAPAMQAALRGVAFGGTVVAGAYPPPYGAGLDFGAEAHLNIPRIVFSRACSEPNRDHPRWNEGRILEVCLRMLRDGTLTGEPVVTPVVRFEDLPEAYPKIVSEPDTFIKLGVEY